MVEQKQEKRRGGVPQDRSDRAALCRLASDTAREEGLVAPLSLDELREHADRLVESGRLAAPWRDCFMVELHNAVWEDAVASIPYDRRLLLLPQCLRDAAFCEGTLDEVGLLCNECGRCCLAAMQHRAEELGYVVLIAEGTSVVTKLLDGGKIDAVIGASCMHALEKSFPHLAAEAVPGLAVPLWRDGCVDTAIDDDRVMNYIEMFTDDGANRPLDMVAIRDEVRSWFAPDTLESLYGGGVSKTDRIAFDWLARGGKRWRPFLSVCVHRALTGAAVRPESLAKLALAIECFHKASLAHDDVEDNDDVRYDAPTLHCQHGTAVAINVGDLLIGDGYRLICEAALPPDVTARLLAVAAEGHRNLCLGQGEDLLSWRRPEPLSSRELIQVFRWKTAPAFDVSLQFGALAAGADADLCRVLTRYSEALGIGYQVLDDLREWRAWQDGGDPHSMRGSILVSLAHEMGAPDAARRILECRKADEAELRVWQDLIGATGADAKAEQMLKYYRSCANNALNGLSNVRLKSALRRIAGQILKVTDAAVVIEPLAAC